MTEHTFVLTDLLRAVLAAALEMRDTVPPNAWPGQDNLGYANYGLLGGTLADCRLLRDHGLLQESPRSVWFFRITPAGVAALKQPGDGLPESHPTDDIGVELPPPPPLEDDVPLFPVAGMSLHAEAAAAINRLTAERDAAVAEARRHAARLIDLQTAHGLLRELTDLQAARMAEKEAANDSLRATLRNLRRDRAEAQLLIDQLQRRLSAPVAEEDVVYELVESKPTKVEVRTLMQNLTSGRRDGDQQLAECLNEGWQPLHIGLDTGDEWTIRIVTLTREVEDDAAGDAPEASAQAEPEASEPGPALATVIGMTVDYSRPAPVPYLNTLNSPAVLADDAARADGVALNIAAPAL